MGDRLEFFGPLPLTDPDVAGQIWLDGDVVRISKATPLPAEPDMTGPELSGICDRLGHGASGLARMLGVSERSVERWLSGYYRRVPPPIAAWLRGLVVWMDANPVPRLPRHSEQAGG